MTSIGYELLPTFPSRRSEPETQAAVERWSKWYHLYRFVTEEGAEVRPERSQQNTPVIWSALTDLGLPTDASNLRVLDVGCCDGFYSFAMEQRGADVVSIDYRDVEQRGFGIARDLIGSGITPRIDTVYNLTPDRYGTYDVVLFLGILYHLRHPLLALDRVRSVMKPGGLLFIETATSNDLGTEAVARYYRRDSHNDNFTDHFSPNDSCVEAWLDATEFKQTGASHATGNRVCYVAEAVDDPETAFYRDSEWVPGMRPVHSRPKLTGGDP